jgi:hypothetical protein
MQNIPRSPKVCSNGRVEPLLPAANLWRSEAISANKTIPDIMTSEHPSSQTVINDIQLVGLNIGYHVLRFEITVCNIMAVHEMNSFEKLPTQIGGCLDGDRGPFIKGMVVWHGYNNVSGCMDPGKWDGVIVTW